MEIGAATVRPVSLFYSYSHCDEALRCELEKHLAFLRRGKLIAEWHDRMIGAGDDWRGEIDRNLASADIVLLLVSADFIASDYCWDAEMAKALARHERGEARVIAVILRPCRWRSTPLAKLQAVPKDGKAVSEWVSPDAAFEDIAGSIERIIKEHTSPDRKKRNITSQTGTRQEADGKKPQPRVSHRNVVAPVILLVMLGGIFVWLYSDWPATPSATAEKNRAVTPQADVTREINERTRKPTPEVAKIMELPHTFRDNCDGCPWMVMIPEGTFMMGSPENEARRNIDEGPQREVTIAPFAIGKTEVTFAEWDNCVAAGGCNGHHPSDNGWGRDSRPVLNVSWEDAKAYVGWLSKESGKPYRLPTEAEWEYAARAGTMTPFSFGRLISTQQANYTSNDGMAGKFRRQTIPCGSLPPNPWGLHEVHGNVSEWIEDCYHNSYQGAPPDGAPWTREQGTQKLDNTPWTLEDRPGILGKTCFPVVRGGFLGRPPGRPPLGGQGLQQIRRSGWQSGI